MVALGLGKEGRGGGGWQEMECEPHKGKHGVKSRMQEWATESKTDGGISCLKIRENQD